MKGQLTFIQGKSMSGKTRLIASSYKKADTLFLTSESVIAVSYTHLDVYKRQVPNCFGRARI